jgi:DNA-binding NtrC family response regulator
MTVAVQMAEGTHMLDTLHAEHAGQPSPTSLDERLRRVEASLIGWALKATNGNKSKAARLLQIKRSTLGDRINRCGLGPQTVS